MGMRYLQPQASNLSYAICSLGPGIFQRVIGIGLNHWERFKIMPKVIKIVKYNMGNVVNNVVIIMYGTRWVLELLW